MNCKQVEELLPLHTGRDLDEKRATLVTDHVRTCLACARVADEYRESVQLTQQFAPPVFSEAVFAGIRQRVLRGIEMEAMPPAWSQTIPSLFQPRLTWAIASVLLIAVSLFAIYFIVNRGDDGQRLAGTPPAKVQPGTKERYNSGPQGDKGVSLPPSLNTGEKEPQQAGVPQRQRKRSRDTLADRMNAVGATSRDAMSTANIVSPQPSNLPEPILFPPRDSADLVKTLRVEIQTMDPNIRIIWFAQQETKPKIPSSKGT
jgi:hypothetical protein